MHFSYDKDLTSVNVYICQKYDILQKLSTLSQV